MTPNRLGQLTIREAPLLAADDPVFTAAQRVVESGLPALPVVDADGALAGIFGEREFMEAVFPGYVRELHSARFVSQSLDAQLELRVSCRNDPVSKYMNTDDIEAGVDSSDLQLAETFLHHRILIIPVVGEGRVQGVVTRSDFFRVLVERFEAVT